MPRRWEGVNPGWPAPIQWSVTLLNDLSINGVMYPCCLYFAVPGLPPTTKQLWLTLHCSSELTELSWQPQTLRETRGWIYVNIDLIDAWFFSAKSNFHLLGLFVHLHSDDSDYLPLALRGLCWSSRLVGSWGRGPGYQELSSSFLQRESSSKSLNRGQMHWDCTEFSS